MRPVVYPADNFIYRLLVQLLDRLFAPMPVIFSLLAFAFLYIQATLLNRICNSLRLFPRPNYLVAMAFLLITSLVPEWSVFSAPLLVNFFMVWIWYRMIRLYNHPQPKTSIYNISVLTGLMPLIYSPALALIILLVLALVITRPFRVTEWMVALLGLFTPYYFLGAILYLTNQWKVSTILPHMTLHVPHVPTVWWVIATVALLALPFLLGAYYVQQHLGKIPIQIRKGWGLLLIFLFAAVLIAVSGPKGSFNNWILAFVPLAAFHGATYFYMPSKAIAAGLQWITFILAIFVNYYL
ncbi:MAG: hypothetical protein INR73_26590 [Williamsia sp.]|nr:hypothetical protein [Williamsia sp.]